MERFLPQRAELDANCASASKFVQVAAKHIAKRIMGSHDDVVHFVSVFSLPDGRVLVNDLQVQCLDSFSMVAEKNTGSEAFRLGALIRNLCALTGASSVVVATNHPLFQSSQMKSSFVAIENFAHFNNTYTTYYLDKWNDQYSCQQRTLFDAHPVKLRNVLLASDFNELHFYGLLNVYDQELFVRSELSMAFVAASLDHANKLAKIWGIDAANQ